MVTDKIAPHYSVIEDAGHAARMAFSRELQERHMRELLATHVGTAKYPKFVERCAVDGVKRKATSGDVPVQLTEPDAFSAGCRRSSFPSPRSVGI